MIWRQYRKFNPGEQIVIFGDCSQGGKDYNACQFISKNRLDVPLVYHARGVAAQMTTDIFPVLEKVFDITGVKPLVAFERNNGGASEMMRLNALNRLGKFNLYREHAVGVVEDRETGRWGFTTTAITRPQMLGDLKNIIDNHGLVIYDKSTIEEMFSFIVNDQGKPEAEEGAHDDLIMSLAGGVQIMQTQQAVFTGNYQHYAQRQRKILDPELGF